MRPAHIGIYVPRSRGPPANAYQPTRSHATSPLLQPWEVLEMDIHDMGARLKAGNRHLLVIVDRASKFFFAYPLPNKSAEGFAEKLLELLLTFGIPLSLRSDPGTEFTGEIVKHLCKWLNVAIN